MVIYIDGKNLLITNLVIFQPDAKNFIVFEDFGDESSRLGTIDGNTVIRFHDNQIFFV